MALSRRVFLGTAAGGFLLAATGGYVLAPAGTAQGFKALSEGEILTVRALGQAYFPPEVLGVSSEDVKMAEQTDAYVANMYSRERHLTRLMLRLMEQRSRVDAGSRLSSLRVETRAQLLTRWEADRGVWGMGTGAIRVMMALFYFPDARVQAACGWGIGCDVLPRTQPTGEPT